MDLRNGVWVFASSSINKAKKLCIMKQFSVLPIFISGLFLSLVGCTDNNDCCDNNDDQYTEIYWSDTTSISSIEFESDSISKIVFQGIHSKKNYTYYNYELIQNVWYSGLSDSLLKRKSIMEQECEKRGGMAVYVNFDPDDLRVDNKVYLIEESGTSDNTGADIIPMTGILLQK